MTENIPSHDSIILVELNKKMLKFAGFKPKSTVIPAWLTPTGELLWDASLLPNFPESLDACFKHFKSKFISMACGSLYEDNWKGAWAKVITHSRETSSVSEPNIEPALALCLAIEKLLKEAK